MNSDEIRDVKLPLPKFLKLFTNSNVPVPKAMVIAGKIYKEYNTPSKLGLLSEVKLKAAGVEDKDDRSLIMQALRKAGYALKGEPPKKLKDSPALTSMSSELSASVSGSQSTAVQALVILPKRKRKRVGVESNEFLPQGPSDEAADVGSLSFNEVLDEKILMTKSTVINRAPVMTAWATFVAERMHFAREEALSIASAYTELNAVSKGTALGIFKKNDGRGVEAAKDGSQPYVELMGRRVPLYRSRNGQWRALNNGSPVQPSVAFSYISRAFRQSTSHIMGALRLLAESYTLEELNGKAWALYAQFRPEVNEWGERSTVSCSKILALRKQQVESLEWRPSTKTKVPTVSDLESGGSSSKESPRKKARLLLEEIERETDLDQNTIWFDIEPDFDFGTDERMNM